MGQNALGRDDRRHGGAKDVDQRKLRGGDRGAAAAIPLPEILAVRVGIVPYEEVMHESCERWLLMRLIKYHKYHRDSGEFWETQRIAVHTRELYSKFSDFGAFYPSSGTHRSSFGA
jgi:hypothetical protein